MITSPNARFAGAMALQRPQHPFAECCRQRALATPVDNSVLLALGVPPRTTMEIVGHSTIEMTMNVYGHVSLDEKRAALDLVGDLFEEPEK